MQSNDRSANIASMVNGDGETPEILAATWIGPHEDRLYDVIREHLARRQCFYE